MCAQTPVRDTMCDASSPPTVNLPYFNPPASTLLLHPFCFNPSASTLLLQPPCRVLSGSKRPLPHPKFPLLQNPPCFNPPPSTMQNTLWPAVMMEDEEAKAAVQELYSKSASTSPAIMLYCLLHSHSPSCACNDMLPELEIALSQQIRQACTCVVCYSIITSSQTLKSLIWVAFPDLGPVSNCLSNYRKLAALHYVAELWR